jgi:hypothetical protein
VGIPRGGSANGKNHFFRGYIDGKEEKTGKRPAQRTEMAALKIMELASLWERRGQ